METAQPIKRPIGMTILLVLSLINACAQIFSNLLTYLLAPTLKEMMESGQMDDVFNMYNAFMDESMVENLRSTMDLWLDVNPMFFLLTGLLYIGSLFGVIRMFKLQRLGFHLYSISQMLILIVAVAFLYSKMPQNPFFSEFLTTVLFILIYHLYLKRIEFQQSLPNNDNDGQAEGE